MHNRNKRTKDTHIRHQNKSNFSNTQVAVKNEFSSSKANPHNEISMTQSIRHHNDQKYSKIPTLVDKNQVPFNEDPILIQEYYKIK